MNRQNLINSIPDLIDSSKEEFDTILFVPSVKDLTDDQKMEDEYELLGFYVSKHPLDSCSVRINDLFKINNLKNCQSNTMVNIGGLVIDPKIIKTKATKKDMCFFKLEDKTGRVEVIVFPNVYPRFERLLTKNNLVEIAGKVEVEEKTINDEEIIWVWYNSRRLYYTFTLNIDILNLCIISITWICLPESIYGKVQYLIES